MYLVKLDDLKEIWEKKKEFLKKIEKILLKGGDNINWVNHEGSNPLNELIKNTEGTAQLYDIIEPIVSRKGFDVNSQDGLGRNGLHFVCENYSKEDTIDVIQLLMKKGIDINSYDKMGDNALGYAFRNADQSLADKVIIFLFRHGIKFRHQHENEKYYNIFEERGHKEISILKCFAEEDITLGWHQDCESCDAIL